MSIGQTTKVRRLLMAALRPLTGVRASGVALVKCSGSSDVLLPVNSCAYPIAESAAGVADVDDQRMIRTAAEVVVPAGASGKLVAVTSLMGGARHNAFDAGTRLLWDPPVTGLETHSVLATDMAGGVDAPDHHPAPIHDVVSFEEVTAAEVAQSLFQARMSGRIPAVVICWDRSDESEPKGRNAATVPEHWSVFVVVENHQGEAPRRDQGGRILDAVRDLLLDKRAVDGSIISDPPIRVAGRRRIATTPTSLVYALDVVTTITTTRLDLRVELPDGMERDPDQYPFDDWLTTRYHMGTVDDATIIDRAVYNQQNGAFDRDAFSTAFHRKGLSA